MKGNLLGKTSGCGSWLIYTSRKLTSLGDLKKKQTNKKTKKKKTTTTINNWLREMVSILGNKKSGMAVLGRQYRQKYPFMEIKTVAVQ